jgi:hypothetical protein
LQRAHSRFSLESRRVFFGERTVHLESRRLRQTNGQKAEPDLPLAPGQDPWPRPLNHPRPASRTR